MAQHHVVAPGDATVTVYGVFANDRTIHVDGPEGPASGRECVLVVTLAADRSRLDGDVARVGFRGSHNGDIFSIDLPAAVANGAGRYDLRFEIHRTLGAEEQTHAYAGAFFVETVHGSYYWLKGGGQSDFMFDYGHLPTLATLVPDAP